MGDNKKLEVGGEELRRIHFYANRRKQGMYWIGFLEGAVSSGRIEHAELPALEAEARSFAEFFGDPDARDIAEDIVHVHAKESNDLYEQISDVIDAQREIVCRDGEFAEKDRLNEFLGFCAGVICDGRVLEREAAAIAMRLDRDPQLAQHPPLVRLRQTVAEAIADGRLTGDEAEDVRAWIARIVGDGYSETGLPSIGLSAQFPDMLLDHDQVEFHQRTFVVTGALRIGPRREIARLIERHGGTFGERITLQTDYVVVALTASRDWRATHFGTKLERTRELIDRGAALRLVAEHAFEAALAAREALER